MLEGKNRNRKIVLMLLAGLIILFQAIIPHHLHFDSIESHPENLECETTNTNSHNENPDMHCHAFNLIFSESVRLYVTSQLPFIHRTLRSF